MTHWTTLPVDRITAANRRSAMFNQYHHAALNTAIDDRTRLAIALRGLLTAVQVALPNMAPAHLLRAEEEAVRALESVGGTEGNGSPPEL